jgi:acetyl esterase/lipase
MSGPGKFPGPGMPDFGKLPPLGGFDPKNGMPPFPPGGPGMPPKEMEADVSRVSDKILDLAYGDKSPNQKLDLYLSRAGTAPHPVIVYIHGGGFAMGSKRDEHMLCLLQFRKLGWTIAAVEYRLSGEAPFPAAVHDVKSAVRFLKHNAEKYGLDKDRFAAMGGSAGGNLSAMLAVSADHPELDDPDCPYNRESCAVAAAVDWFGPVDFAKMDEQARANGFSFTDHGEGRSPESQYLGTALADCDPKTSAAAGPFPYLSKDMAPILIEHGSRDRFVPPAQSEELYQAVIAAAGKDKAEYHVLAGADHGDPMFEADYNMETTRVFLSRVFQSLKGAR